MLLFGLLINKLQVFIERPCFAVFSFSIRLWSGTSQVATGLRVDCSSIQIKVILAVVGYLKTKFTQFQR